MQNLNPRRLLLSAFAITGLFLASCADSSQLTTSNSVRNPQFLDNVSLSGSHSSHLRVTTPGTLVDKRNNSRINPAASNTMQEKFATLLGVLPTSITNTSLYSFIDEWLGVRYRMGGTSMTGIDCSAFCQKMFASVWGINLVRTAAEQFSASSLINDMDRLKEGDLVFFRIRSKRISHVGVYLANHHFVHASCSNGVAISSLDDSYYKKYYAGGGRVL